MAKSSPFMKKAEEKKESEDIVKELREKETKTPAIPEFPAIPEKKEMKPKPSPPPKKETKEEEKEKAPKLPAKEDMKPVVISEKRGINWNRGILYLTTLGIIGIIFFSQMVEKLNPAFLLLIWIFGMLCFLPLGVIMGWFFLDPHMRCKIMRRTRSKNYAIVNFVHKGGKRITQRIRDLGGDVIVEGGRLWLIDAEGIYYMDKDNNKMLHAEIKAENVITLPSNVPEIFLDTETMIPLKFHKEKGEIDPQEAGATIIGWVYNQAQKSILFKRTTTIFYILLLGGVFFTLVLVYQNYDTIESLKDTISTLQRQTARLIELMGKPPVEIISLLGLVK